MKFAPPFDGANQPTTKQTTKNMEATVIEEFRKGFTEIQDEVTNTDKLVASLTDGVKKLQEDNERLQAEFTKVRSLCVGRTLAVRSAPTPGMVSDECAAYY